MCSWSEKSESSISEINSLVKDASILYIKVDEGPAICVGLVINIISGMLFIVTEI